MSLAPLHRRRGFRLAVGLILAAAAYGLLYRAAYDASGSLFQSILLHLAIGLAAVLLSAALVAQFLLPVRRPRERQWAIGRLLNHMLGERGPVTLVRDGQALEAAGERARRGPGVLLMDHCSAAVLRTDLRFTRTVGPGTVAFTEPYEWLAASLDLRRQRRTLLAGPPTTGAAAGEQEISTLGITRDGVPVTATLQVTFMLDRKSPLARGAISDPPPYSFSPQAIQQAVYGQVVHEAQDLPWSELPLRLAVDAWRELVKEIGLNQLSAASPRELEQQVLAQLAHSPRGGSPAAKLLEDRGIRVLAVRIEEIHLPAEIRQERLQEWFESWSGPVQRELSEAEGLEREARRRGQSEASASLARSLTHRLVQGLRWDEPLGPRDSLLLLFEGALEHCSRDPRLAHLTSGLREAAEEIKGRDAGCRELSGGRAMSERLAGRLGEGGLPSPLSALLQRGQPGSRLRFGLLVGSLSLYWFLVTLLSDFPPVFSAQTLAALPPLAAALLEATASFFAPQVLIFVLPAILGVALALYGGAQYLADLYELETPAIAWRYLLGAVFGLWYPTLAVQSGDLESLDQRNPLLRIGGPGYLILHLGFAAVFETPTGQPRVYGPSRRNPQAQPVFIPGFERLREVIDLRDQLRQLDQVPAVTKDGIEVFARDVQVVFRVSAGERRSLQQPYPYDPRSILSLVYGQVVAENGPSRWTEALPDLARSELRSFVAQRTLEEFLAIRSEAASAPEGWPEPITPSRVHIPRRQLTDSFHTPERQLRLKELGLELVWVGVGTWEVRDDQIRSIATEVGAGHTLTATLRDQVRARRLRTQEHLARERQLAALAYSRETLEELVQVWRQGQLPGEFRCFESLERIKRRLMELQRRVQEAQAPGEDQLPEGLAQAIQHLDRLTDRSPAL